LRTFILSFHGSQVRVCGPCYGIASGKVEAVPELPISRTPQDMRAARDELFANPKGSEVGEEFDDSLKMQQERELAQLQQEIFAHTANTIEIGADTLNVLHAQRGGCMHQVLNLNVACFQNKHKMTCEKLNASTQSFLLQRF